MKEITGQLVDIYNKEIFPARIRIEDGKIHNIERLANAPSQLLMPGFVDAHIHIESSMLTPAQFAIAAVRHGTVGTVSDPHEIANVCGMKGVEFMLENAKTVPMKFHFGAPSCVPATDFETAGAILDHEDIATLMARPDIYYLSEVMNFPAVIHEDAGMMKKLAAAQHFHKPIDGHAPGMQEVDMPSYFSKGISTDHECVALEEALAKIRHGCKILIREGSAAKNFEALIDLFSSHPATLMFCSDDLHPDDLQRGHINLLVKRALAKGCDFFEVLHAACLHPIHHYRLPVGTLRVGDAADFIVVKDAIYFEIMETWIDGNCVFKEGNVLFTAPPAIPINQFNCSAKVVKDFELLVDTAKNKLTVQVIEALDGQLITDASEAVLEVSEGKIMADQTKDILKIVVVNRYEDAPVAIGFIRNFNLKNAAIGATIAHDSHNIVVVGTDDYLICKAVNVLVHSQGGMCFVNEEEEEVLALPIAGLMSDVSADVVGAQYERLSQKARNAGSTLTAPFMTLSFMALPVIPLLKITDKGLFDVGKFGFTDLVISNGI